MKSSEYLNHECDKQLSAIASVDEVILYGKTTMRPVLEVALHEFGVRNTPIRVFDSGEFLDGGEKTRARSVLSFSVVCEKRPVTACASQRPSTSQIPIALTSTH